MKSSRNFSKASSTFYLFSALVVVAILWAVFFEIETSAQVSGELIPQGRSLKVQNRFQGQILRSYVEVGQQVVKGDLLVEMETMIDESEVVETGIDLEILYIVRRRLMAQLKLDATQFLIGASSSDIFNDQRRILVAEIEAHREQLRSIEEDLAAMVAEIKGADQMIEPLNEAKTLSESKLRLVEELYNNGFEGELSLLKARQELAQAKQEIASQNIRMDNLRSKVQSTKAALRAREADFKRSTSNELSEVERKIRLTEARKRSLDAKIKEYSIVAPVNGVISREAISTSGGVMQSGTSLLEIIPEGIPNVFFGKLAVSDAFDIFPGQGARVTLVTMDGRQDSPLDAVVLSVDPDVTTLEDGSKFYGIILSFKEQYPEIKVPGVSGTAFLLTGSRSVLAYLAEPIFDTLSRALKD